MSRGIACSLAFVLCWRVPMRFIAGAVVVLSGCILWGSGACAVSMVYMAEGGNLATANIATYGGMAVVAGGCLLLLLANATHKPGE